VAGVKKYIKRLWFTVAIPITALVLCLIAVPVEFWPEIWRGEHDHEDWDFWNS
jgi:hypothetical protein